ncbi:MAG: YhcH/YjgK/YiaL family protein [Lachnospiraceae bacterium]|nr:YhcH/YjgK/YiaL family protein [Lachnospiraceae bacterium]
MSQELRINDMEKIKEIAPEVYAFINDDSKCNTMMPDGKMPITDECYAIVSSYTTADRETKEYESHRKYLDVQMLIEGKEYIEIAPITELKVSKEYVEERDVMFFSNEVKGDNIVLEPMKPALLLPETGHMPGVICGSAQEVKKIVVKIPVSYMK